MTENPLIIAGSGRSGTTWILDVLAEINGLRTIFEPLHPHAVRGAGPYAYNYIAPRMGAADLEILLNQFFSGTYHSIWTDYRIRPNRLKPHWRSFSSPGRMYGLFEEWRGAIRRYIKYRSKLRTSPVLVKMIRGNLMLGWLREKYDARIVFVVRHPGAVAESKVRLGGISWDPKPMLEHYRMAAVSSEGLERYRELLKEDLDPIESHTLTWCIENQLPLEQSEKQGYLSVFYEDLVRDGENEWLRIIKALNLTKSPWGSAVIDRPSQQASSSRSMRKHGGGSQWYDRVSEKDLDAIERVLSATGVDAYTAFDPLPRRGSVVA